MSEVGLPVRFVVHVPVFSTYFIFTPCLTASTLIIPVLDLDVLFHSLRFLRDIGSDRYSTFVFSLSATVSASGLLKGFNICARGSEMIVGKIVGD